MVLLYYLDGTDSFTSVRNDQYLSSFTTTTIGVKNIAGINAIGDELIMYCFANVDGYQRIGSYVGTGGADLFIQDFNSGYDKEVSNTGNRYI